MGLFGGCGVNEASVAACSKQMHSQLIQRQHVLKVVHQLKKVSSHAPSCHDSLHVLTGIGSRLASHVRLPYPLLPCELVYFVFQIA